MTRSDLAPRRLHPITPLFDVVVVGRQAALPALIALVGGGATGALVVVGGVAAVLAATTLRWLRFRYRVEDDALRIEEGVFVRKHREVPLERIQQVDVVSKLRHRLVGVVALHVDTAGGAGGAEANLSVVSRGEAARLRGVLLGAHGPLITTAGSAVEATHTPGVPQTPIAGRPVAQVATRELALAGITGAQVFVMLTIVASLAQLLDDLPDSTIERIESAAPEGTGALLLAAFAVVPLWLGLAAAASIFTDFGYTLTSTGTELHVRRGLLDQREATVALHRVQALRIHQTLLRRMLRRASVHVQSAGAGTGTSSSVSRVTIPLVHERDLPALLAELAPGAAPLPPIVPAPPAARRRAIVRRVVPWALVAAAATVALWPWGLLVALVLPVAAVAGEVAYRGLGHARTTDHVIARSGSLFRETVIVPVRKAQSARLRSSPLQRRAGLATLAVEVAGRGSTPRVYDGDAATLEGLLDAVLASRAAVSDEHEARRRAARDRAEGSAAPSAG